MHRIHFVIFVVGLFLLSPARGQDTATTQPVSRQEFDQLKKDDAEVKNELADVKKQQADQAAAADQDAQDNDKQMKTIQDQVNKDHSGLEGFVIAGDANIGLAAAGFTFPGRIGLRSRHQRC